MELLKDRRYWIRFYEQGDVANHYLWSNDNGNPYARGNSWTSVAGDIPDWDMAFKFYEQHFESGHFRSQENAFGSLSYFGNFYEDHEEDEDLSYNFKVRKKIGGECLLLLPKRK